MSFRAFLPGLYAVARPILVVGIIGYLVVQLIAGREAIAALEPRMELLSLGGAFIAAVLAYQCLFAAWLLLLRVSGHFEPADLGRYARIWWISYLYRYVPGKLLLVVERARLGRYVGIPASIGAALAGLESVFAILAGSVVGLLALPYYFTGSALGAELVFAGVTFGSLIILPVLSRWITRRSIVRRRYPELDRINLSFATTLLILLPYIAHYALLGLSFFLLAQSVVTLEWQDLAGLCGIYALSHVIGLIAFLSPAGLGVREGTLAIQLWRIAPVGVAEALAIGIRLWFTAVELLCFGLVAGLCPRLPGQVRVTTGSGTAN
ncbi:MAG: hypothetical protein V2I25_14220 [Woeseiaceae bacterium]|nr:hypothetical protein [Woeseiaceae bacterium]